MTPPVTILEGCAYSVLQTLPDNSVDCIITSPPYWGLRDYGIPPTDWPACAYAPMPGLDKIAVPAETSCLGLEPTLHAFLAHLVLIFEQCRRVLKPTGSAWVNMGDGYASNWPCNRRNVIGTGSLENGKREARPPRVPDGMKDKDLIGQPWRVAFALQAAGWYLRQDNIWHKPNPMPESVRDRATKSHEYVFHLTKSERYFFDLEAWSEKASEGTNLRISKAEAERIHEARSNGANTSTGKSGHGSFHRNGRKKGAPARKLPEDISAMPGAPSHKGLQNARDLSHGKTLPEHDGRVKNNASMDASLAVMPLTRNKRSVWTVPTVAYSEAHYATYPPRLITPPLLASTSAKGCCSQCGRPWERIVEKVDTGLTQKAADGWDTGQGGHGTIHRTGREKGQSAVPITTNVTTGWHPTCDCQDSITPTLRLVSPSLVLDPFGGSGTTAQVALDHGRHAILIERGAHNIAIIRKRLAPFLAAPVLNLH